MVHNTRRKTQPWKSGLPVDFIPAETNRLFPPIGWLMRARRKLFGDYGLLGSYIAHPDRNQENLFFGLLRECVEQGIVTPEMLREEMRQNHVRHDAFEVHGAHPAARRVRLRRRPGKPQRARARPRRSVRSAPVAQAHGRRDWMHNGFYVARAGREFSAGAEQPAQSRPAFRTASRKSRGVRIRTPLNGSSVSRSASPVTIQSASPLIAVSRNLSSSGSRQA